MSDQTLSDRIAAVAIAVMLILTAWGNAVAMLVVSGLGLIAGLLFFRKSLTRGAALAAAVGFGVAIIIALFKWFM